MDEFRLKSNEVPPFPPVYKKRTDFLRAARLHWSGVGSDRDQVVLFAAQPPNNSTIRILNVDDNGKISVGPSLGVAVVGEHFVGMDAGRFDPPKVGNSNNFNRQISVLLTNNPKGTELFTYSVDDSWNLKLESLQNLGTNHYFGYGSFDDLDGMLHAIDAQSRSLKLGSPIKISVEDHLQPDVVLAIPPMHIDYIRDATGNGPKPLNLTVFPSTPSKNQPAFNTQFSFNSEGSSESKSKEATDSTWGFGGSVSGKVVIGDEKLANVTVESKLAAEGAWGKSNETKNSNYQTTEKSLNATTGFADHIYFTSSRQNTWAYPILGLRCPVDGQACPQKDKKTQFVLMSAPDMVEKADLDATTQEWYQPVQEPGNLFSYPWNQDQLKLVNPRLNRLTEPNWKLTDTAITSGKTVWKQGGSAGTTTGSVAKNKESLNISVSGQYVTPFYSAKGKVEVDISHSGSLETENTSTTTLDASTGIQTNTPGFTDSVATRYFYYYSSYVFGENPLGDSLITPKLKQADGQPVGQQVFGPLTVAYAADPFHGAASANWWRQAYIKPDIGLNHPSRWTWDRVNKIASFNYHEPITDPPNPRTILNDVFYKMKGLFISEASDDPANRIQRSVVTAGDVIQIQARVYNFSVADMPPGSSAHARFYGQEYDQSKASLAGDAFPIGEDNNGAIPGFNSLSNLGTLPNWKMASTTFDTKNYSGKFFVFWVVVWAEDADGKLLQEVEAHGLKQDPSTLTFKQITDVPVEDYSNNVGIYGTYTPFFVAPKISSSSTDALAAPIGDTRQLQTNDVLVEATPACAFERSWVRVTLHNTTGGDLRSEPVFFYDGDPASGGKAFDMQRIPFVAAGDTYALRTFLLPETSGPHNIFVRVGHQDINSSNPAITTLNVP